MFSVQMVLWVGGRQQELGTHPVNALQLCGVFPFSTTGYSWVDWLFLCVYGSCLFGPHSVRLSEGFNFAASGEGIVNMVTELPMQVKDVTGTSPSVYQFD